MTRKPVALTISGSDPSGGAGLQADLKTFQQFGVYGMAVVTLITVQNTREVSAVEPLPGELVRQQIEAVVSDIAPGAAKTGSIGTVENIEAAAACAREFTFPLVVDPVMVSKHGALLMAEDAKAALVRSLLPRAFLVTPNRHEAAAMTGLDVHDVPTMEEAARRIADLGPKAVLVKGAALTETAVDVLWYDGRLEHFPARRIDTNNVHGTGCTYSAAITASLARGDELPDAISRAKRFITRAIALNPGLGGGCGPVEHHAAVE